MFRVYNFGPVQSTTQFCSAQSTRTNSTGIITINARSHRIKTFPRALDFIAVQSVVAVAAGADAARCAANFCESAL